jgi:hypothetical protein
MGIPLIFVLYYRTYYIENLEDKYIFILGFLLKIIGATAGMVVRFTSYNFGAPVRYKIPSLSTYLLALFFILDKYNHTFKAEN